MKEITYRINEIFYSLQGEGYHAGQAAIFIRLSGCNLKCPFCGYEIGWCDMGNYCARCGADLKGGAG